MSEKVVGLHNPVRPMEPTVTPEVISQIEGLLEEARAGEIVGFAYVSLHPGDITSYHRSGRQARALLGAMEILKHDMCKED